LKNFSDKECTKLLHDAISLPTASDVVNMMERAFKEKEIDISTPSSIVTPENLTHASAD
jgi:hypothetical protein